MDDCSEDTTYQLDSQMEQQKNHPTINTKLQILRFLRVLQRTLPPRRHSPWKSANTMNGSVSRRTDTHHEFQSETSSFLKSLTLSLCVVPHTFNSSTGEAEAGESL